MRKIVFLLFITIITICGFTNKKELFIPKEAIRIRIIANSNDIKDQKIKSDIKNEVNKYLNQKLSNVDNYEVANKILIDNIENIKRIIENYTTDYEINYGENLFPEKKFKGVNYKKGYYNSIVIKIGEGKGNNFWCILFPPLCLIDEQKLDKVEYGFIVKELLNKIK